MRCTAIKEKLNWDDAFTQKFVSPLSSFLLLCSNHDPVNTFNRCIHYQSSWKGGPLDEGVRKGAWKASSEAIYRNWSGTREIPESRSYAWRERQEAKKENESRIYASYVQTTTSQHSRSALPRNSATSRYRQGAVKILKHTSRLLAYIRIRSYNKIMYLVLLNIPPTTITTHAVSYILVAAVYQP